MTDKPPQLIWAASTVYICASCGAWLGRYPAFLGTLGDKGDQCYRCGSSYCKTRRGRPFSNRSDRWIEISRQFRENYESIVSFFDPDELKEIIIVWP